MKWLSWFAVALPLMVLAHADLSSFSDFDFTVQPKTLDKDSKTVGDKQKLDAHWAYDVEAENKSARDYADVEFQYIIFRKEALIGNKSGAAKIVRKTGSAKAPAVAAHGRFSFTTDAILDREDAIGSGLALPKWRQCPGLRFLAGDLDQGARGRQTGRRIHRSGRFGEPRKVGRIREALITSISQRTYQEDAARRHSSCSRWRPSRQRAGDVPSQS